MLSIDQLCQDNVAKYYAAILKENAAVPLQGGGFGVTGLETPERKLVLYNIFRKDGFEKMYKDELVPDSLKSRVVQETRPQGRSSQRERIKGWHVLRTEKALQGEELRDFLSDLEKTMDSGFYSKSTGRIVKIATCLIEEKVYTPGQGSGVSSSLVPLEKDEDTSGEGIGDVYKVFIEVKNSLGQYCEQLLNVGRTYGAIANPLLTQPELAGSTTKADYYVVGRDSADVKSRATALGEALQKLDFVKNVHVQNYEKRN